MVQKDGEDECLQIVPVRVELSFPLLLQVGAGPELPPEGSGVFYQSAWSGPGGHSHWSWVGSVVLGTGRGILVGPPETAFG